MLLKDILEIPESGVIVFVSDVSKRFHITSSRNILKHLSEFAIKSRNKELPQDMVDDMQSIEIDFKHCNRSIETIKQLSVEMIQEYTEKGYRPYYNSFKTPVRYSIAIYERKKNRSNKEHKFDLYLISKRRDKLFIKSYTNLDELHKVIETNKISDLIDIGLKQLETDEVLQTSRRSEASDAVIDEVKELEIEIE